jgi:type IV pilus assembly protein PilF
MDCARRIRAWRRRLAGSLVVMVLCGVVGGCAYHEWKQQQADAHLKIGIALLGSGQFHEAMKELLVAESNDPSDPLIHYNLGIAYHGKGLDEKAIEEFRRALALKPDYAEASNYLGALYLASGRWDDAIRSFEAALANIFYDTPSVALYNMGWAHYKKGNLETALQKYQLAIRRQPSSALLPLLEKAIGLVKLDEGNVEGALLHFSKSVELAPFLVESHYWMGVCYERMKDRERASRAFQTVIEMAPDTDLAQRAKGRLDALP